MLEKQLADRKTSCTVSEIEEDVPPPPGLSLLSACLPRIPPKIWDDDRYRYWAAGIGLGPAALNNYNPQLVTMVCHGGWGPSANANPVFDLLIHTNRDRLRKLLREEFFPMHSSPQEEMDKFLLGSSVLKFDVLDFAHFNACRYTYWMQRYREAKNRPYAILLGPIRPHSALAQEQSRYWWVPRMDTVTGADVWSSSRRDPALDPDNAVSYLLDPSSNLVQRSPYLQRKLREMAEEATGPLVNPQGYGGAPQSSTPTRDTRNTPSRVVRPPPTPTTMLRQQGGGTFHTPSRGLTSGHPSSHLSRDFSCSSPGGQPSTDYTDAQQPPTTMVDEFWQHLRTQQAARASSPRLHHSFHETEGARRAVPPNTPIDENVGVPRVHDRYGMAREGLRSSESPTGENSRSTDTTSPPPPPAPPSSGWPPR